jgi:hypothetical protein
VSSVEITPSTGSVLVSYDPAMLDVAQLLQLGAQLGWLSPTGDGPEPGREDWRSYVDLPRARRALMLLGIAGLGALVAPTVGVSARVGSVSASIGYIALTRWVQIAMRSRGSSQ